MNMPSKVKNLAFALLSISVTSFILCFSRQQPVNFIVKASKQLKENLQVVTREKKFEVDDKYLIGLGFHKEYVKPQSSSPIGTTTINTRDHRNQNGTFDGIPFVIVSAVKSNQLSQVSSFLKSISGPIFSEMSVVLWDLEIMSPEVEDTETSISIKNFCNSTSRCWVETFSYNYPAHVKDLQLKAYRPLIIQTMLERGGGCVLWIDIDRRLLPLSKKSFEGFLNLALNGGSGIVGWSTPHPTSTLTHPKTFAYFQTEMENYYFHRMIDSSQLLVCNTKFVHTKIMKPWIECTLTLACISPVGAQYSGCRFDKKPLYRYSSCHGFENSALNIALGLAFPLHQPYISRSPISRETKQTINLTQTTNV